MSLENQNEILERQETEQERVIREAKEKAEEILATKAAILFVHGLDKRIDEGMIYKLLENYSVMYIKLAKEEKTGISLGYAFVGFNNREKAGQALREVNYTRIMNKTVRLSWYDRTVDNARKKPENNIFVKNLPKSVGSKEFHEYFEKFGTILAAKVVEDEEGDTLGYGYVLFKEAESAKKAIEETNGKFWKDTKMKLYVCQFEKKRPRKPLRYNNLYVRNIPKDWDVEQLKKYFSKYGEISSAIIRSPKKERVNEKTPPMISSNIFEHQYGFVCFKTIDGPAETAVMKVPYLKLKDEEYNKKVEENAKIFRDLGIKEDDVYKCTCYVYEYKLEEKMKTQEGLAEIKKSFEELMEFYDGHYVVRNVEDRLHCCRAMKKKEREKLLRLIGERLKKKVRARYKFCNLYIKHLPDDFDNNRLTLLFGKFGIIRSGRVLRSEPVENQKFKFIKRRTHVFAYVCYQEPEQAKKARKYMNGKQLIKNGPRLYVDYHQPKSERLVFLKLKMIKRFENNPNKDMIKAPTEPVIYKNGIHPPYGHFVFNNPLPVMNPPVPINQPVQNMPNMSNVHDQNIPGRIQMIPVGPSPQMLVPVITEPQIVPPNVSNVNANSQVGSNIAMMPHMIVPYNAQHPMMPYNPNVPMMPYNPNVQVTKAQQSNIQNANQIGNEPFGEDFNINPFNDKSGNENIHKDQEKEHHFVITGQELKTHPLYNEMKNYWKEMDEAASNKVYSKLLENERYSQFQHLFPKIAKAMLRLRHQDIDSLCSNNNLFIAHMDNIIPLAVKAADLEEKKRELSLKEKGEEDIWKIGIQSRLVEDDVYVREDENKKPKLDLNKEIDWEKILGDVFFGKKKEK